MIKKILLMFLTWRIFLVVIAFLAVAYIPLGSKDRYLGGSYSLYQTLPHFFSWANFDGEHYLFIAIYGYKDLEQAFFPFYPMLISFFAKPFSSDLTASLINYTFVGLIISNVCLLLSLIYLWKLIKIDYPKKIAFLTIIILLIFPTSFYFGALYNESLFLFLSVISFYNFRKRNFVLAGIFGMFSAMTRIFGILLFPAFLIEIYISKIPIKKSFWIFLIPLGLVGYMWYQYTNFKDPFAFYNLQKIVGEQHQEGIILLPQVFFRYIKMLLAVNPQNPIYQTIILEFLTGLVFLILPIVGYFKKIRLSYLFYAFVGFLMPTIQGSLSSLPRYVLILFPSFLIAAMIIAKLSKAVKILILIISLALLITETTLFLRGYWVA